MTTTLITPFTLAIEDELLVDLRARLASTRWPDQETVDDWSQGVPLAQVQALVAYWRDHYDWRRCEAVLNRLGQFKTEIDGLGIHFLHVRSPHAEAMPLIMTHGWPGSIIEFSKVIEPLTNPTAFGGEAKDAFHVVLPSLPGYGFSDKPAETGWNLRRIAKAWSQLMLRLGYPRYVAQGGDWGSFVTMAMGSAAVPGLIGLHVNLIYALPPGSAYERPTVEDKAALAVMQAYIDEDSGYSKQQSTRPQTLGYGLADSPAGQAAWIYEKFWRWTDCGGDPTNILTYDEMLDNIMLYWLSNAGASSARLYWEAMNDYLVEPVSLPLGYSAFPKEILQPPRAWVHHLYSNIIHWNQMEKGGHFAAFEQPELFVSELRTCFGALRDQLDATS